jgi:hypothetical protein
MAGSPADIDDRDGRYRSPLWEGPGSILDHGTVVALLTFHAATQHLRSLSDDILGDRPAAAAASTRACLEGAARTWLLADGGIDLVTRLQRVLNDTIYGAREAAKALGGGQPEHAAEYKRQVEQWLGLGETFPELGAVRGTGNGRYFGAGRPGLMDSVEQLLPSDDGSPFGTLVYRVLSASAHASLHGFKLTGVLRKQEDGAIVIDPDTRLPVARIATQHLPTVWGYSRAARALGLRMGWTLTKLDQAAYTVVTSWTRLATGDPTEDPLSAEQGTPH